MDGRRVAEGILEGYGAGAQSGGRVFGVTLTGVWVPASAGTTSGCLKGESQANQHPLVRVPRLMKEDYWASISLVISTRVSWLRTPLHLRKTVPSGLTKTVVGMVVTMKVCMIRRSGVEPVG